MRMFKILAATVAAAAVTLGMSVGPVQAHEQTTERVGFGTFDVFLNSGDLVAKGHANNFRRRIVLIQRAPENSNRWTTIRRLRTSSTGNFRTVLRARTDIPCAGTTRYKIRAKKKGLASWSIDRTPNGTDLQVWSC